MSVSGNATTAAGDAVDHIRLFKWPDGPIVKAIQPDSSGYWTAQILEAADYGVTYIADGCQPVTHGPYFLEPTIWLPSELSPILWLDADDEFSVSVTQLGSVNYWSDKSGNGNDIGSTLGEVSLTPDAINGRAAITIGPANSGSLEFDTPLAVPKNYTMFFLKTPLSWGSPAGVWRSDSDSRGDNNFIYDNARPAARRAGTWVLQPSSGFQLPLNTAAITSLAVTDSGASYRYGGDEKFSSSVAVSGTSFNLHRIGWQYREEQYLGAHYGEILVFTGELPISDRQKVEGYLAHKWGIEGSLPAGHPYKNAAP